MEQLQNTLRKYWGYDEFRPLQLEAMQAVLSGRDSVVVMPTGGGKSLCFQAPALCMSGMGVVISPLISLMKDQVDALTDYGVPAACVNSTLSPQERREVAGRIERGELKLLYLSPERLMTAQTLDYLEQIRPAFFAIDEAHCISDWGHDFRPEYRALKILKQRFPGVGVHSYTATATPRVRDDIVRELGLRDPERLVGSFDRPNLVYRVARRTQRMQQISEVVDRHPDESGIVYCIRRTDVEEVAAALSAAGRPALPYHAGLTDVQRSQNQEAFITDRVRIIVATVAFGMGIDKSDVRYVIHAGAPKSLEAYQQESGRAGRDGLEAECCLFYTPGDFQTWRVIQQDLPSPANEAAQELLAGMERFCTTLGCRHRSILDYFGQSAESENCRACDSCLDEHEFVEGALVLGQKILSCVVRLEESFGADYTAKVLCGSREQRILDRGHERLSTYNLLQEHDVKTVRAWIEQLIDQQLLQRVGEYNVLHVTPTGWEVLRGNRTPQLLKPAERAGREARVAVESWEGVDRGLFEELRKVRRRRAEERGLPPFVVFGDATLRDLARRRPSRPEQLLAVHGIGEQKAAQYGEEFLAAIAAYCDENGLERDVTPAKAVPVERPAPVSGSDAKLRAFEMFLQGQGVDAVSQAIGRARSTTYGYLVDCIGTHAISEPESWVDAATVERVQAVLPRMEDGRLKSIHEALSGEVSYEEIRIVVACMRNAPPVDA